MDGGGIKFWATLIKLTKPLLTAEANRSLVDNCTPVTGRYWIMEGDTDYLRDQGVPFIEVAQGAVGSLGGLSELELERVCLVSFGVRL